MIIGTCGLVADGTDGRLAYGELGAALHAASQVIGGDPVEVAVTAAGWTMEDTNRQMAGARYRRGGGDGVVARPMGGSSSK